jgi:hypothetical protein
MDHEACAIVGAARPKTRAMFDYRYSSRVIDKVAIRGAARERPGVVELLWRQQ